jgi:uncharacterized membrane protein YeiH
MIELLEFLAVITAGLYGVLLARSKGMDLVGVCAVAFIVAFGGGTLRDVLLDRQPLFWIAQEHYTWTVFGIALLGGLVPRIPRRLEPLLVVPDALGMALFSIVGAGIALETAAHPVSWFIAALFGVLTGAFGGVIADVICNEVPRLFLPTSPLYSVCGFAGCWLYLVLRDQGFAESVILTASVLFVVAFRLAAVRWNWRLAPPRASVSSPASR